MHYEHHYRHSLESCSCEEILLLMVSYKLPEESRLKELKVESQGEQNSKPNRIIIQISNVSTLDGEYVCVVLTIIVFIS